jgi:hypothetical protein
MLVTRLLCEVLGKLTLGLLHKPAASFLHEQQKQPSVLALQFSQI